MTKFGEQPKNSETPQPTGVTRRDFLRMVAAAAALVAAGGCSTDGAADVTPENLKSGPALATDPFSLGVASGDPLSDRVILWTRLAPDPLNGGGMPDELVPVGWQIATDDGFTDVVNSGSLHAATQFAHSVHVDADGLQPDSWYYYRFFTGNWISPVARTRTLPDSKKRVELLKLGVASCQNYKQGYFSPYAHLAKESIELLLFVGDYIYESASQPSDVRQHSNGTVITLEQYRERYAQYKMDPQLMQCHHQFPWVVLWDDHEVANNYVGVLSEHGDRIPERRRAAYQAYYENMPLRVEPPEADGSLDLFRSFRWGDLIQFSLVDTRQYRTNADCTEGNTFKLCDDAVLLGSDQKAWLMSQLTAGKTLWNSLVSGVVFSQVSLGNLLNIDQWDGYPGAREAVLNRVLAQQLEGFLVFSGDIHSAGLGSIHEVPTDVSSRAIGNEIVTNSISSGGSKAEAAALAVELAADLLDHIRYASARGRGYTICEIRRNKCAVHYRIVDTVDQPESTLSTHASWVIDRLSAQLTEVAV